MSLRSVLDEMRRVAESVGRDPDQITLVAVGKSHGPEAIRAAYEQGHRDFGENRAQELAAKAAVLPADIRWHFIGPLQRNKVKLVRPIAHLLHSMDRPKLARAWVKEDGRPPPALLQVNIGREPQKAGVEPTDAIAAFHEMSEMGVDLRGLMAIPPMASDPEEIRPFFRRLRELRDELSEATGRALELSMGMTDDFAVAVEEGSTMIRVGRAIFGPRPA